MADYTTNLNLKKPAENDFYHIQDFNDNADKIDAAIAGKSDMNHEHTNATPEKAGFMSAEDKGKLDAFQGETAASILTKIKTVDGAGSGLDADTLDGKHASEFALEQHSHTPDDLTQPIPIANGGTGATTAEQARANLGIDTAINNAVGLAMEGSY